MENSFRFFENRDCQYYPCHRDIEHINCLFCYCPFFFLDTCPGTPEYLDKNGKQIKVCTNCNFPHEAENYPAVIRELRTRMGY